VTLDNEHFHMSCRGLCGFGGIKIDVGTANGSWKKKRKKKEKEKEKEKMLRKKIQKTSGDLKAHSLRGIFSLGGDVNA